ncbi:hypothetical protein BH23CHL8_BH23CHL8_23150 [soil metagenome]
MVGTTQIPTPVRLALLSDELATVVASEDVRGFEIRDAANRRIGSVEDLAVDPAGRVRFLKTGTGGVLGLGRTHRLIPVDIVESVADETVFLKTTSDRVADSPEWESLDEPDVERVCSFHGCRPPWSDGYVAPDWTGQG